MSVDSSLSNQVDALPSATQLDKIVDSLNVLINMQLDRDQRQHAAMAKIESDLEEIRSLVEQVLPRTSSPNQSLQDSNEAPITKSVEVELPLLTEDCDPDSTDPTNSNPDESLDDKLNPEDFVEVIDLDQTGNLEANSELETGSNAHSGESSAQVNTAELENAGLDSDSIEKPEISDSRSSAGPDESATSDELPTSDELDELPTPDERTAFEKEIKKTTEVTTQLESTIAELSASLQELLTEEEASKAAALPSIEASPTTAETSEEADGTIAEPEAQASDVENNLEDSPEPEAPAELSTYEKFKLMMQGETDCDTALQSSVAPKPETKPAESGSSVMSFLTSLGRSSDNTEDPDTQICDSDSSDCEAEAEVREPTEFDLKKDELRKKLKDAEIQLSIQRARLVQQQARLEEFETDLQRSNRINNDGDKNDPLSRLKNQLNRLHHDLKPDLQK